MSRIVWFALGAFAGMTYATRVIRTENLDLAPGQIRQSPMEKNQEDLKTRLSTLLETQSEKISTLIRDQGQALASKLRGESAQESEDSFGPILMVEEIDIIEPMDMGTMGEMGGMGRMSEMGNMATSGAPMGTGMNSGTTTTPNTGANSGMDTGSAPGLESNR